MIILFSIRTAYLDRYILNLTELPNLHPDSFIYLQLPVKDSSTQDILPLFDAVFNFIDQVKILIDILFDEN